jgi:hypothetical protein
VSNNKRVDAPGADPAEKLAFVFHARRGLPRSPTVSVRFALSKGDHNVLQAIAAATDKANRQHFGAAPVQPIEPSARARWPEMEPTTQCRVRTESGGRRRSRAGPRPENVSETGEIESCET